jgi:hypothetical protein
LAILFGRPLLALVPQALPGIHCDASRVCTDDTSRLDEARSLYAAANAANTPEAGPLRFHPAVTFCSTTRCAREFGLGGRAAETIGGMGIAVSPRGWKECFVRHELIHCRQSEELGLLAPLYKPDWLIEGMAYSLSGDPRHPLAAPFEQWRSKFDTWNSARGNSDLWQSAARAR